MTSVCLCPSSAGMRPIDVLRYFPRRVFSSTSFALANRAIVYSQNGEPGSVLRAVTYPLLPPPPVSALTIRYLLAPVNPSDVNVVEGVYPAKPAPASHLNKSNDIVYIGGNEGVAEVVAVGPGVDGLTKGDWVVMSKQQSGTWATQAIVERQDVIRLEKDTKGFRDIHAATLTVSGHFGRIPSARRAG